MVNHAGNKVNIMNHVLLITHDLIPHESHMSHTKKQELK